jgi:hypothetical protein
LLNKFQRDERKGEDLTAVDLFKATNNSSKNGFSEAAKDAIVSQSACMRSVHQESFGSCIDETFDATCDLG